MGDLVSRLLEAITAKEEKAHAAIEFGSGGDGPWRVRGEHIDGSAAGIGFGFLPADREFIVDNDPSSVLRRCSAVRKLLELHKPKVYETDEWNESRVLVDVEYPYCPRCWAAADYPAHPNPPERYPCDHVRLLAEAYGLEVTE